jgi:TRAP-type C4-dicarboxylate transport system permease small subunit
VPASARIKILIARINDGIARGLLVLAAMLGFLLSFLVCADVIGRVAFSSPVKGTPEIVSYSIVVICFLQAAYAIRSGAMIWVDAVVAHLPRRGQLACESLGALLGAAFFGIVGWGAIDPAVYAWTSGEFEGEGALRVPAWPARFIVVLGALLAALNYALVAADKVRLFVSGTYATAMPPAAPADERPGP